MSNETGPGNVSPDPLTDLIRGLIGTMGGEENGSTGGSPRFTPPGQNGAAPESERNEGIEGQLFNQGVLHWVSPIQRQLLGCVACKLRTAGGNGQPAELRITEIAQCSNITYEAGRRLLDSLCTAGLLRGEVKRTTDRGVNPPTRWFSLTKQADESGFTGAITAPEQCGLTDEARQRLRQPIRPRSPTGRFTNGDTNQRAEQFLLDMGMFQAHKPTRRAVLGCMACRFNKNDGVFGLQVARCQGITHTTAGLIFSDLANRGIVTSTFEGRRVVYRPSTESPLGQELGRLLEVPQQCGIEHIIGSGTEHNQS